MSTDNPLQDAIAKVKQPKFLQPKTEEPTVVIEPAVEEVTPEITLEQQFQQAQAYLEILNARLSDTQKEIHSVQVIVNNLADEIERVNPKETSQQAILRFLGSKRNVLENRSDRLKLIKDSGIDLNALAKDLKSPLDAALSRKKAK